MLASLFLLLIFFLIFCGVVGSWSWVIWRLQNGQAIIPRLIESKPAPWGLGSVLLAVLAWLLVNVGLITIYLKVTAGVTPVVGQAAKAAGPAVARTLGFTEQMVVTSLINGVLLLIIPLVLKLTSRARLADLGIARWRLGPQFLVGTLVFFLVSPFVYALNGLAILIWKPESHPLEKMIRNESSMGIAELAVLSAVLLAPATEELIFRGVIQRWLSKIFNPHSVHHVWLEEPGVVLEAPMLQDGETPLELASTLANDSVASFDENPFSPPSSPVESLPTSGPVDSSTVAKRVSMQPIVLTSTLFALVHFPQWPAPLAIFFLSLGLGYVFERSGSLIASMVMHALFNGLGTLLLFIMVLIGGEQAPAKNLKATPAESKKTAPAESKKAKIIPPSSDIVPEQAISRTLQAR
ncbi:CAAX amino terminal protease family [Singulisphaera acidiphila DSM 18658]|uniref:CAAX amino terminal protease family n=1 Tax=Singulisphaera acidiphila (strain ATCC BAA-1392 / DSM 18658 / VKM B-2454 / MOB10) TaxID=886293 RepID=L0DKL5_SINAD|nr:CAAX amino terminal protease family [Singulisphaera acidiphila DSM 18658]